MRSFAELLGTPFVGEVNALCWGRTLPGDFGEIVNQLPRHTGILPLDEDSLRTLPLSRDGAAARAWMLEDLRRLQDHGLLPELNCIQSYPADTEPVVVAVDVYSFHADRAPVPADTWLCTYHGASSEGVANDEVERRVDLPATREALLAAYGGRDGEGFREFLSENSYDLHYALRPNARPFSFGIGNLWRVAVDYPGSPVLPCIHRAPVANPGDPPRLLLIS